jgi:hypothetical protein
MKKLLTILLSSSLIAGAAAAQSLEFTTGAGFSIDPAFNTMASTNVTATGTEFSGTDLQVISGIWSTAQDMSAWGATVAGTEFHMLGEMTTVPSSLYSVTLYDSAFNTVTLTGGEWGKIDLTFDSVDLTVTGNTFAWNDIGAIDINTGGAGAAVAGTLTQLTIPEPSSAALLAGLLALGSVMLRRRAA